MIDILVEHLEEAAFLWTLREQSRVSAKYHLNALGELDERLEAHLDGLRIGGEQSWNAAKEALKLDNNGDIFVLSHLAFDRAHGDWIGEALQVAIGAGCYNGLVSALCWLPYTHVDSRTQILSASEIAEHRYVAVAVQALHRVDGDWLSKALHDTSALVQARAGRAAGELGRADLVPQLLELNQSKDESVAFWSCWSAALLGDQSAVTALQHFATVPGYADDALAVVLRRLSPQAAGMWLEELAQDEVNVRLIMQGAGIVGDPVFVPGLISMMSVPAMARIAADSFCNITGANLTEDKLGAAPPLENQDAPVQVDLDENLPWPDPQRVFEWWEKNGARFNIGTRYLLGQPVTPEHLRWVLRHGNQKLRYGAALELAMLVPETAVFATRAPGFMQLQSLGV
ncbi:MAG: TIGR02270 family protein [Gammaproteobacteria bacterium]|nr:TIGR02270 family protein [Gammaproteobacteria bacterium]